MKKTFVLLVLLASVKFVFAGQWTIAAVPTQALVLEGCGADSNLCILQVNFEGTLYCLKSNSSHFEKCHRMVVEAIKEQRQIQIYKNHFHNETTYSFVSSGSSCGTSALTYTILGMAFN